MKPTSRQQDSILVIRMGAMGDIIHALPAVASLRKSFPHSRISWLIAPGWMPLLAGNPNVDHLIPFERAGVCALGRTWRSLRTGRFAVGFDFQGLLQSALAGKVARLKTFYGFDESVAREPLAAKLYSQRVAVKGPHRIERNLQLVQAAGAEQLTREGWIPEGCPEDDLPAGPFVLTSPFAGWVSKQWPASRYEELGKALNRAGVELVANVSEERRRELNAWKHVQVHSSSIAGLIWATRRATAVLGLDSGPLHLAAALQKPGVALFGPTDPAQTGPYGGSMTVLRAPDVETTYKRHDQIHPSMANITIGQVLEALLQAVSGATAGVADRLSAVHGR